MSLSTRVIYSTLSDADIERRGSVFAILKSPFSPNGNPRICPWSVLTFLKGRQCEAGGRGGPVVFVFSAVSQSTQHSNDESGYEAWRPSQHLQFPSIMPNSSPQSYSNQSPPIQEHLNHQRMLSGQSWIWRCLSRVTVLLFVNFVQDVTSVLCFWREWVSTVGARHWPIPILGVVDKTASQLLKTETASASLPPEIHHPVPLGFAVVMKMHLDRPGHSSAFSDMSLPSWTGQTNSRITATVTVTPFRP